ncbi:hypothetical protein HW932_18355 [Allochromatium humboldtianum]|uniref:Uncharacterized protein n=1 Tax=Allochromatium humboldtianum TaxID=504901 RepID=A0A850RG94_9GAMM|nr:hypothetical protein [Allochromatium humboldtianum]NVZ11216.1 hypothetical protein [Allochromatium humboldtianum]
MSTAIKPGDTYRHVLKLKGSTLACARFGEPEFVAATFSDDLSEDVRHQIQADILAGQDLLAIFHGYKRAGLTDDLKGAAQVNYPRLKAGACEATRKPG